MIQPLFCCASPVLETGSIDNTEDITELTMKEFTSQALNSTLTIVYGNTDFLITRTNYLIEVVAHGWAPRWFFASRREDRSEAWAELYFPTTPPSQFVETKLALYSCPIHGQKFNVTMLTDASRFPDSKRYFQVMPLEGFKCLRHPI
jgi:hypothetical protein